MLIADVLQVSVQGCITDNQSEVLWDPTSRGKAVQPIAFYRTQRLPEIAAKIYSAENFVFKRQQGQKGCTTVPARQLPHAAPTI